MWVTWNTMILNIGSHLARMVLWVIHNLYCWGEMMKIIMFLSIYGLSVLPLSYTELIVFSRLEQRHTIHVYGLPCPPNPTMETLGLAMNALCVSVCVPSCLPLQVVYFSRQICSFLQNFCLLKCVCYLCIKHVTTTQGQNRSSCSSVLWKLRCESVRETDLHFYPDSVIQPVCYTCE